MFNRLYLSPGKVGANTACTDPTLDLCTRCPFTAGWTEAVWNTKFARHFYTWPALGIEPLIFWSWVPMPYPLGHLLPVYIGTISAKNIYLYDHISAHISSYMITSGSYYIRWLTTILDLYDNIVSWVIKYNTECEANSVTSLWQCS